MVSFFNNPFLFSKLNKKKESNFSLGDPNKGRAQHFVAKQVAGLDHFADVAAGDGVGWLEGDGFM
jgi:hypothetical protein